MLVAARVRVEKRSRGMIGCRARELVEHEQRHDHDPQREHPADLPVGPRVETAAGVGQTLVGEAEQDRDHADREQRNAAVVEVAQPSRGALHIGQAGEDGEEGQDPHGHVDVEDPVPADVIGDDPAEEGPDDEAHPEDGPEQTLVAAPFPGGEEVADHRQGDGEQAARTAALERPESDQLAHVLGQPGERRPDQEDEDPEDQGPLPAEDVAQLAVDRHRDRAGEQVGGDHPGVEVAALEVADDPGQGDADDGLVQGAQEQPEQHRPHDDELLAGGEVDGDALGLAWRAGGGLDGCGLSHGASPVRERAPSQRGHIAIDRRCNETIPRGGWAGGHA